MKNVIILTTLLLAVNTSALAQRTTVVGTAAAIPSRDFPKQCAAECAEVARLFDMPGRNGYDFYGCGNWAKKWGYGSDDGSVAGVVRALEKALGSGAIAKEIKNLDGNIADINQGEQHRNDSDAVRAYFVKSYEIDKCVLKTFVK